MDELLLHRAQRGDPEAFESLMGQMEALVWRVCWHYTGSREDAVDCGQETMVRIWRGLSSFHFECAFETWVYRVAANCCLDFLRKRKRDKAESLEPLREQGFDPPDPAPDTEEQALRKEEHARLREAVAALPEDQRDALVLTQLEGRSYEEAARLLETTEGTVKSRVARARDKLKRIFAEEGELSPSGIVQRSGSTQRRKGGKDRG
jgi:RNA polymerase sigma-70 factor (ECF subfamily)